MQRKNSPTPPFNALPQSPSFKTHVIQLQTLVCPIFFVSVAMQNVAGLVAQGAAVSLPF